MIKKLFIGLMLMASSTICRANSNPIVGTVQLNPISQQSGGFNTSTGTVSVFTANSIGAVAITANSITGSSVTIKNLTVTGTIIPSTSTTLNPVFQTITVSTINFVSNSSGTLITQNGINLLYSSGTVLIMSNGPGFTSNPTHLTAQDTGFGFGALTAITSASDETAFGASVLASDTGGNDNTGMGVDTLVSMTTGSYNTAIGSSDLDLITTGFMNTCLGVSCLAQATGGPHDNIGIGVNPLFTLTNGGNYNTSIGNDSLANIVTGSQNVAIGHFSGVNVGLAPGGGTKSTDNVFVGYQSGYGPLVSTGSVFIGAMDASIPSTAAVQNAITLGWDANPRGNNTAQIGGINGSGKEVMMFVSSMTADSEILSPFFTSSAANSSATGVFRLPNNQSMNWRNAANNGDLGLLLNTSNQLTTSASFVISPTSNQLILGSSGSSNFLTITAPTPVASQTITIPDPGAAANFILSKGTPTMGAPLAMGSNKITGLANGSVSSDAVAFGQLPSFTNQGVVTVFTTNGTFTTPSNSSTSTLYQYTIIGGGGGGGGSNGAAGAAAGGGAGAIAIGTFTGVAANTGILISTGTAGSGGASTGGSGGNGTASSIGSPVSITAGGGVGGTGSTSATTGGSAGGTGGTVTGSPAVSILGGNGGRSTSISTLAIAGNGANSLYGNGGIGGVTNVAQNATACSGYGSGGGGAILLTSAGASGCPGIVIIQQLTP